MCLLLSFCFESMELIGALGFMFYVSIELIWFPKHYNFQPQSVKFT